MFPRLCLAPFALGWFLPALVTKENDGHTQVPLMGWKWKLHRLTRRTECASLLSNLCCFCQMPSDPITSVVTGSIANKKCHWQNTTGVWGNYKYYACICCIKSMKSIIFNLDICTDFFVVFFSEIKIQLHSFHISLYSVLPPPCTLPYSLSLKFLASFLLIVYAHQYNTLSPYNTCMYTSPEQTA